MPDIECISSKPGKLRFLQIFLLFLKILLIEAVIMLHIEYHFEQRNMCCAFGLIMTNPVRERNEGSDFNQCFFEGTFLCGISGNCQ
jgi:hypothetical protein